MICRDFHAPCPDVWWTLSRLYHFAGGVVVADSGTAIWVVHLLDTQAYHLGIGWNLLQMLRREGSEVIECATPVWVPAGFVGVWVLAWEVKVTRHDYLRVLLRISAKAPQGTAGRLCWRNQGPIHTWELSICSVLHNHAIGPGAGAVSLHETLFSVASKAIRLAQAKSGSGVTRLAPSARPHCETASTAEKRLESCGVGVATANGPPPTSGTEV